MRVLSLFDGMACGMLAMLEAGIDVERYVAFEIDKYAIKSATHNFPMIEERGDVFKADFTEFRGFDFLAGGSPCTFWSIAKKTGRETEASGMGWELFSQYVRALREAQPRWFVYENNKSMSNAIRESITKTFGFEPICINSALVSAQNRQRLYWVGRRNEDGTYSKVDVEQPEDRGILLKDVLDGVGAKDLTEREMDYMVRDTKGKYSDRWSYLQKPAENDKALCITANIHKGVPYNICAEPVRLPAYGQEDKARPLGASYSKNCGWFEHRMFSPNPNKQQVDMVAEPVCEPVCIGEAPGHNGKYRNGKQASQQYRVYSTNGKTVAICGNGGGGGAKTGLYAIPVEFSGERPIKAVSCADGKAYTVYEVKDGQITIKGKRYAIKLADGFYIIRKLTVSECKRLQTVPEWYEFPVSDSQAYKQLGNGWTILIISHLLTACLKPAKDEDELYCDTEGNYRFF